MLRINQIFSYVALSVLLFAAALPAHAQGPSFPYEVDSRPSRGIMPTSEQLSGPLDNIEPTSGTLHIQIPLASLPAGHAGSGFDLALTYNSHLFDLDYLGTTVYNGPDAYNETYTFIDPALAGAGWIYNFKNYSITEEKRRIPQWETNNCGTNPQSVQEHERTFRYRVALPDGSQHILHLLGQDDEKPGYWGDGFYAFSMAGVRSSCATLHPSVYPSNLNGPLTFYTTDGSYLRLQINADGADWRNKQWTLLYPDGRRVVGRNDVAEHLYDANNNGIHIITGPPENGHTVAYIADDFSRKIRIEYSYTSSATEKEDKITADGPHGLLEWRVKWQRIQIGGQVDGQVAQYICTDYSHTPCGLDKQYWVVKYIQLPLAAPNFTPSTNNTWTYFEFTYPTGITYGHLASMRVPSGAVYSYSSLPYNPSNYARDIARAGYTSRTVTHDGVSEQWTYNRALPGLATVTGPDGGQTIYHSYDSTVASQLWSNGLVYWIEEPNGTVRKRQWTRNRPASLAAAINVDPNNPYVERESVTVDAVVGQPRTTVADILIDKNGNTLRKKEYGWSSTVGSWTLESPGPLLRTSETSYHVNADTTPYWNPSSPPRLNAARRALVRDDTSAIRAATEFTYDDPLTRGNVIQERRWDDATPGCTNSDPLPGACPAQARLYSTQGNLTDIYEPAIRTHIEYIGGPYPTLVTYGTDNPRSFTYDWNQTAGTLNFKKDKQNDIFTYYDYDLYGRQTAVNEANLRITRTEYDDEHRSVLVKHDLRTFDDGLLQSISHGDQLGRPDIVRTSDGSPLTPGGIDGIKVSTTYQTFTGGSRVITTSPYRNLGETGMLWSCTEKDQSGRIVVAAQFKGAAPTNCTSETNLVGATTTEYHVATGAPRTRVKDPASNLIDHYVDALGRLGTVVEDPTTLAFHTTYEYGVFNNLIRSTQTEGAVTQQRTFTYTSLGRLHEATNPETGKLTFEYYPSGDLRTRKDARNFLTTLEYDDLHRIKSKVYSSDGDVTPDVSYTYHTAAPCIGQLESIASSAGTTSSTCDVLGRTISSKQTITGGGIYPFKYTYWLNDSLKTMEYPSSTVAAPKVVNYDVDNAGRAGKVYAGSKTYADMTTASTPAYRADGRLTKLKFGNGLWETRDYQIPGIPTVLSLGTTEGAADRLELKYNYAGGSDNGNLLSHTIRQGATAWSQTYQYDALNRLTCATEATGTTPPTSCTTQNSWRQTYGIDRFGNRWTSSSTGFPVVDTHEFTTDTSINKTNNRLNDIYYDAAGNRTNYDPWTLTYDGENRLLRLWSSTNGESTFTYDGAGRRIKVETIIPTPRTTLYIYDAGGRLAAEYSSAPSPSGTSYLFSDLLGTPRAISGANGQLQECSDYTPFGRLLQTANRNLPCHQAPQHASQQFTGQVRDLASNLDYFGARYYSGGMGRFLSPDDLVAQKEWIAQPQRWNRYAYALNNPLKYVDPDGKDAIAAFFLGEQYRDVSTWDVVFSKYTLKDISKGWDKFADDHQQLTHGLSPAPVSKLDLGLQAGLPLLGKFVGPIARKVTEKVGESSTVRRMVEKVIEAVTPEVKVFRQGTFANEAVNWEGNYLKGKQWAAENPLTTPDYAKKYGLPSQNAKPDWVIQGTLQGGYKSGPAPASHNNPLNTGGGLEIRPKNVGSVRLDWFHMPD
jgi:RHS repeat-associated protein